MSEKCSLGHLGRYGEALAAAGQARHLADQVGTTFRLAQAHGALGQLLFETGRWDVHSRTDIARESALRTVSAR